MRLSKIDKGLKKKYHLFAELIQMLLNLSRFQN
jgi:hypothetical protein